MLRRSLLLIAAALALALPAPAGAVVGGEEVLDYADYPAQAFIGRDTNGTGPIDEYCTGTLIGSRQILTAARCASYGGGLQLPEVGFKVRIGDPDRDEATPFSVAPGGVERHPDYDPDTGANDVAIVTLSEPVTFAAFEPVRVLDAGETSAWTPGTPATVLGWGEIGGGFVSEVLRTGAVSILPDADCAGGTFDPELMLCAAGTEQNPCAGDSGSPLLVPDGTLTALAGVFSGAACSSESSPGTYARVGADPLNTWVHDRTPQADFELSHQPRANEPVTLTSVSTYPPPGSAGDDFFDTVKWDLDRDGQFDDKAGKQIAHTFTQPGTAVVGIQASNAAAGDRASAYFRFEVEPDPSTGQPGGGSGAPINPGTTPPTINRVAGPRATILVSGRPKVRKRRFAIRIRFAQDAPAGTAVIEVYRGKRRIGIARTSVKRGATKRVRVKLTPQGRRILRRAENKRLRIRVRVRVGRDVLRTKRVTIRR